MSKILIKRSSVAGKVPTTADVDLGELAINTTDGKLYLKRSTGGTDSIVDVGDAVARLGYTPLNKAGDTMTGDLNMGSHKVTGLLAPTAGSDATNKTYLEQQVSLSIPLGSVGQIPFIKTEGTRVTEQDYMVKFGQFVETDTELTAAQTRVVSGSTIFSSWYRYSHNIDISATMSRTSNVATLSLGSAGYDTSFSVGASVTLTGFAEPSFNGTFVIASRPSTTTMTFNIAGANVASQSGLIARDNVQPALSGELNGWAYDSATDTISSTINSISHIGFVSDRKYAEYTHEVQLKSTSGDDDAIGILLAWNVDSNGREHTLTAVRSTGGMTYTWRVIYDLNRSTEVVVADGTATAKWGNGLFGPDQASVGYISNAGGGWNGQPNGTKISAVRNNDIITVKTSQLNSTTYDNATTLTIDLTSAPYLEQFRGPKSYGYMALSQQNSTYTVLKFSDGANVIYDTRNGNVYRYTNGAWALDSTTTLIQDIGYGRTLWDQYTKKTYFVDPVMGVTKITKNIDVMTTTQFLGPTNDTAAIPGYSWSGDTDTGIYRAGADSMGFTVGGAGTWFINSTGGLSSHSTPPTWSTPGKLSIAGTSSTFGSSAVISRFESTTPSAGPGLRFGRSRSATVGSFAAVAAGDSLGEIAWYGADGTQGDLGARIRAVANENFTSSANGAQLELGTVANGTTTFATRMILESGLTTINQKTVVYDGTSTGQLANGNVDGLVVDSVANTGITILTANTAVGQLRFGDTDHNAVGGLSYSHTSDTLTIAAGGANVVTVNATAGDNFVLSAVGDVAMRIKSTGTAADSDASLILDAYDASGEPGVYFQQASVTQAFIDYNAATGLDFSVGGVTTAIASTTEWKPGTDNTIKLGNTSARWSQLFAGTATISTSDAREKTAVQPLTSAELEASKALSREIGTYQFLSAVAAKGANNARLHAGMTVQRAIEIMESFGLDPLRYGFICYDSWDEVVDSDGTVITPAGDRYSFRGEELLMFIARGIDARLTALESN